MIEEPGYAALRAGFSGGGQEGWRELALRHGKTFRVGAVLATCEPEAVRALLMDRVHTTRRSRVHEALRKIPGADGILFLDGEAWTKRLRAVTPVFHAGHVDGFCGFIHTTATAYRLRWEKQGRLEDLFTAVSRLGSAVVLKIGYGVDPESDLGKRLASALMAYKAETVVDDPRRRLDDFPGGPGKILHAPWIGWTIWRTARRMKAVRAAVREALAARPRESLDWLGRLGETDLSFEALANEANHLYGAYNAIDYAVTCGLLELARRPDWLHRLRAEWRERLGDRPPTPDTVGSLRDTSNVMREVLRLYPVTQTVSRRLGAPLVLGGETHPEGTEVLILLSALHHHPDHFDDPERFDPDRWNADPPPPKLPGAYVPFLDGPRKCIGRHLAETQFVVVLHALMSGADFVRERDDIPLTPFAVPRFRGPLPVVVRSVNPQG